MAKDPPDQLDVVQWITLAEPGFVESVDGQGGLTYSFDISKTSLPENSTYAGYAEIACAIYNTLPATSRVQPAPVSADAISYDANCVSKTGDYAYWWGAKVYFNHCACNDVELVLGGAAAATGLAAGILGIIAGSTTVAPPVAAVAAALMVVCLAIAAAAGTYLVAFQWADTKSNNGGAFLNFTWASPGTPWVTPG